MTASGRGRFACSGDEGDGYVVMRAPDTEVVKRALKTVIETIKIHYA